MSGREMTRLIGKCSHPLSCGGMRTWADTALLCSGADVVRGADAEEADAE